MGKHVLPMARFLPTHTRTSTHVIIAVPKVMGRLVLAGLALGALVSLWQYVTW